MPRGVLTKSAHPLFAERIGRMNWYVRGSCKAYSENTHPRGFDPTMESMLSDPISCIKESFISSIFICWLLIFEIRALGMKSRNRLPSMVRESHITFRACE